MPLHPVSTQAEVSKRVGRPNEERWCSITGIIHARTIYISKVLLSLFGLVTLCCPDEPTCAKQRCAARYEPYRTKHK